MAARIRGPDHVARQARVADAARRAEYITALPNAEHDAADWQVAMEMVLLAAERDAPEMLARTGMMRVADQARR